MWSNLANTSNPEVSPIPFRRFSPRNLSPCVSTSSQHNFDRSPSQRRDFGHQRHCTAVRRPILNVAHTCRDSWPSSVQAGATRHRPVVGPIKQSWCRREGNVGWLDGNTGRRDGQIGEGGREAQGRANRPPVFGSGGEPTGHATTNLTRPLAPEQSRDAQIETIMFDNRRKLNQIVGWWRGRDVSTLTNLPSDSILQVYAKKVKEAIYGLEFSTPASPECSLSLIEKATNYATELGTIFLPYVGGEVGGDHAKVIKAADGLSQSLSENASLTPTTTKSDRT